MLSEDESWSLLSSMSLGRLVTILGGQPEIFPVNFVTQRRTVLFRTAQGTKLFSAVMSGRVAFEADDHDCRRGVERDHQGQGACAVGQRRHPRRRGSAVAAVDRDVEASLRTGDRHRRSPAGGSSSVPSRTANPPSLDDCCATWQRNRHTTSAAKCIRSRDFRPSHVFRLRPTVTSTTFQVARHTGPAAQLRHGAIYQNGCRLNRPTGPIHSKKSQKRISDVREVGNIQGW